MEKKQRCGPKSIFIRNSELAELTTHFMGNGHHRPPLARPPCARLTSARLPDAHTARSLALGPDPANIYIYIYIYNYLYKYIYIIYIYIYMYV